MTNDAKVLWGEGLLLTPQHFQQWDRFHEHGLRRRVGAMRTLFHGMLALVVDEEALLGGKIALRQCAGVLPSGAQFDAPGRDQLPAPRAFAKHFDPAKGALGVHLGIPTVRTGGLACAYDDTSAPTPFVRRTIKVGDENRTGAERDVDIAVLDLRLLFDGEPLADYDCLRIASLTQTPTGGHAVVESYVPPCLHASVSPLLMRIQRRLIEVLAAKSEDLAGQQRKTGGMAEAMGFWLLHTVNNHLPRLLHYYHRERVHPEDLYLELAGLAGELCTFAGSQHPRDLPRYRHDDLGATFSELDEKIRHMLDRVAPTRCIPIPLERSGQSLFAAQIHDDSLLTAAQLYVAVAADMADDRVIAEFPRKTKASSRDRLQQLIMMALPGLGLKHVPNPPGDIPIQPGRVYFRLERAGEHWDAVAAAHSLALHVPPDFPELRLELMAVKD